MKRALPYERYNTILQRLYNGETLSITALAREFQTTPKTVSRDFKKLMEGNYGITRAEDGKRFMIPSSVPTTRNANTAIDMLDSLAADIGGDFYTKAQAALKRIEKHIRSPFYARIDTEDISGKFELIQSLEEAIAHQRQITFDYKTWWKQKEKIRTFKHVHPYKIIIFEGFFYLLAKAGDLTIKFYLKEIRNLRVLDTYFDKDETILDTMEKALHIWFDPDAEPFEVVLLLDPGVVVYLERKPIKGQFLKKKPRQNGGVDTHGYG